MSLPHLNSFSVIIVYYPDVQIVPTQHNFPLLSPLTPPHCSAMLLLCSLLFLTLTLPGLCGPAGLEGLLVGGCASEAADGHEAHIQAHSKYYLLKAMTMTS